jgi:hypothetical protein
MSDPNLCARDRVRQDVREIQETGGNAARLAEICYDCNVGRCALEGVTMNADGYVVAPYTAIGRPMLASDRCPQFNEALFGDIDPNSETA